MVVGFSSIGSENEKSNLGGSVCISCWRNKSSEVGHSVSVCAVPKPHLSPSASVHQGLCDFRARLVLLTQQVLGVLVLVLEV